jgi:hypothetical protein
MKAPMLSVLAMAGQNGFAKQTEMRGELGVIAPGEPRGSRLALGPTKSILLPAEIPGLLRVIREVFP